MDLNGLSTYSTFLKRFACASATFYLCMITAPLFLW